VLLVALAASCARPVQVPGTEPAPATRPTAAAVAATGSVGPGAPDSSRPIPSATPALAANAPPPRVASDSLPPDVTPAELAREVVKVFGDSAPPTTVVVAA